MQTRGVDGVPASTAEGTRPAIRPRILKGSERTGAAVTKRKNARPQQPLPAPLCECNSPCEWYGPVGGYGVKCETCNYLNALRQRRGRKRLSLQEKEGL